MSLWWLVVFFAKSYLSLATPQNVACHVTLTMGFPRQEYWSGLPFPSLRDLPNPGIKPESPDWQEDSLPLSHQGSPNKYRAPVCQVAPQSILNWEAANDTAPCQGLPWAKR